MHLQHKPLYESRIARADHVHCATPRSGAGSEEYTFEPGFIFPRRGIFRWHVGSHSTLADANTAVIIGRETAYRISHPADGGDECIALRFSRAAMDAAMSEPRSCVRPIVFAPLQQRQTQMLFFALERASDELAGDEIALTLLRCISGQPVRAAAPPAGRKIADEVREMLAVQPQSGLTLQEIGERVHVSPYHLARLFRSVTGTSIHGYRTQMRLSLAFERLRAGWTDIAALALDLGFTHHSHFTAAFRKAYGVPPSHLRGLHKF